jgi:glycerophosphoryl diester phosphodiesterase
MRRVLIGVGVCTLAVAPLAAVPAAGAGTQDVSVAATKPVSSFKPVDAKRIAKWDRMWFRGAGQVSGTDIYQPFSPPTAAEVREEAPAATSIGVINIGWWVGTFPALPALPPLIPKATPEIPNVNVPKDMQQGGIKTYVWYNTLTGGDQPDSVSLFGIITSPGWNQVAGTNPPPDWIATDETAAYKSWANARGKSPIMVAHRGGGEVGQNVSATPENSLAAFRQAIKDGAGVLETDVQWTKPAAGQTIGVPILMHDQSINRTAKCKASATSCVNPVYPSPTDAQKIMVSDLTKAQLDQYQLANGESIPTLQQFLDLANTARVGVLPEIKNWADHADALQPELMQYTRMVLAATAIPTVIIGNFDPTILQWFKDQGTLVKQTAKCAKLPKKLAAGSTTVLLKKTCKSNAGRTVKVFVSGKKSLFTMIEGKNGRVTLKVANAKGKLRVGYFTKVKAGYTAFAIQKKYSIGPARGNG